MLQDWTDEQLNLGITVMSVLTFLAILIILALWVSPSIAAPMGLAPIPPTSTPRPAATLPPTWTPPPTETATPTRTPRPTETPTPTPTGTPTETATPDVGATLTALPTNTATTVPPSPPPIEEPPPVSGGGGGGNSGGSTAPPPPPTATPTPLYVLTDLRAGANCDWVGFFGYVYQADGRPRPNTNVRVFNEFGFEQTATTRNDGYWEVFLDSQPRADLAGSWHMVVLEEGERASNEIVVLMGPDCTSGRPTRFKADWQRSIP